MSTSGTENPTLPRYVEAALPVPLRRVFTYRVPEEMREKLKLGARLMLPFGRRNLTGYAVGLHSELPDEVEIDESKIKDIIEVADDEPLITPEILKLTQWTADYYASFWGEMLKASLPAGINSEKVRPKRRKAVRLRSPDTLVGRSADTPVRIDNSPEEVIAGGTGDPDKSVRTPSGRILIDGNDLRDVKLRDYRRHLGVVLQDNFLFDGTIVDNIRFSNPEANLDKIKEVCKVANADEFIEKFPNGYETIVGERGVKLSGGQRQRIAIARALLADPRILILDEATSSLDSESEALIQEGLNRLRKGRTTFVIAHRLSTIRSADQILVVEAGEILERGTHAELVALDGRYKQLYDKQYRFEQNLFVNPGEDFTGKPPETFAQTKL